MKHRGAPKRYPKHEDANRVNCTPACKACAEEDRARARIEALDDISHGKLREALTPAPAREVVGHVSPRWRVGVADSSGLIPIIDEHGRACAFVPALYPDAGKVAERIASVPALVRKLEAVRKEVRVAREAAQFALDEIGDL